MFFSWYVRTLCNNIFTWILVLGFPVLFNQIRIVVSVCVRLACNRQQAGYFCYLLDRLFVCKPVRLLVKLKKTSNPSLDNISSLFIQKVNAIIGISMVTRLRYLDNVQHFAWTCRLFWGNVRFWYTSILLKDICVCRHVIFRVQQIAGLNHCPNLENNLFNAKYGYILFFRNK